MFAGFFLGMWSLSIIAKIAGFSRTNIADCVFAGLIGVLTVYTIFTS
jgi:hypothetical protein